MLDKRTNELINGALDGELGPAEQMEFNTLMAESDEARRHKESLSRLIDRLAQEPEIELPEDFEGRLLRAVPLPASRAWFTWSAGWMQGKPVSHGLAAAAGLLAAVAFYEFSPGPNDISSLVGTLSRGNQLAGTIQLSYLDIDLPDVQGKVFLDARKGVKLLRFDIDSARSIELEVDFAESGLRFGGFATGTEGDADTVIISDDRFRISHHGAQKFSVILQDTGSMGTEEGSIVIGVNQDGAPVYSGVLSP